jgi:hypothetical protein
VVSASVVVAAALYRGPKRIVSEDLAARAVHGAPILCLRHGNVHASAFVR